MKTSDFETGNTKISLVGPVHPRLLRTVPQDIVKVIGNFDDIDAVDASSSSKA